MHLPWPVLFILTGVVDIIAGYLLGNYFIHRGWTPARQYWVRTLLFAFPIGLAINISLRLLLS